MLAPFQSVQFTQDNVEKWLHPPLPPMPSSAPKMPKQIAPPLAPPKTPSPPIPEPVSFEDLFVCFYYLQKGEMAYQQWTQKDARERQLLLEQEKILWQETLKKGYKSFPINLFKADWPQMEQELSMNTYSNKPEMQLTTFLVLCFVYQLDVYLIHETTKKYFHLAGNAPPIGLRVAEKGGILIENKGYSTQQPWRIIALDSLSFYQELPKWEYKWKAISSYKKEELISLCQEHGISLDEKGKFTKPQLYELLVNHTKNSNPF